MSGPRAALLGFDNRRSTAPPAAVNLLSPFRAVARTGLLALSLGLPLLAAAATVVVDTGHTPQHPGAHGPDGQAEYGFNLRLSDAVSRRLREAGIAVTRVSADGREIELQQRTQVNPQADLFVSIHHDSIQQAWIDAGRRGEFKGYALFVSEKNPRASDSLRCAEHLGRQMRDIGETPSLYHATPIAGEDRPLLNPSLGIHRFDDLVVLKTAAMPAVLIEAGVIANPTEESRLAQPDTVERLAGAMARGIALCLAPPAHPPDTPTRTSP